MSGASGEDIEARGPHEATVGEEVIVVPVRIPSQAGDHVRPS